MKVSDVAKLTGVTVRTLHYYDEIGLLPPSEVTSSGYRVYNDADLEVLQQILFFRELDFSLEEIRGIMQNPAYEKETALQNQKALLVQKRDRLDRLIALVDKTLKGERDMSFKQFDTTKMEEAKQQYAAEVKQRWGNTVAYAEYEKKSASYNTVQQKMLDGEGAAILNEFGKNRSLPPDSVEVQELVKSGRLTLRTTTTTAQRRSFPAWVRCMWVMSASRSTSTSMVSGRQLLWRRQ